ncbi:MAG: long-chain fatty acid--CoA ligase [Thermoplasmata archaeon]|nr:long-chain fatty acid--CoA ligase [Thermoplasmata archaeon]
MATEPDRPWLSHYPPRLSPDLAIPNRRLPDLVEDSVRRHPKRTALIYYGARWSYEQLWEASGGFARALHQEGFRPGDRLALYLPNCPAYPIAYFGALRLGLTVVQVSPLYIEDDLVRLLDDAKPRGIVTLDILYPNLEKLAARVVVPVRYVARLREFYPFPQRLFVNLVLKRRGLPTRFPVDERVRPFARALKATGELPIVASDPASEVAVIQYTGGTTGQSKGAMLSHRNLVANALQCQAWFSLDSREPIVVLAAIPFFHIYAMTVAMNYPLIDGGTLVLETRPEVDEILRLIKKYRPTQFPGVPALYQAIVHHKDVGKYDIRSIKVCVSGAAALPREVQRRFEELTGGYLVEGYGLTEASPVTHANPIGGERRAGTIGLPFPSTYQRVVDLETGTRTLPVGEPGELTVRGPQVMLGYLGRPEESAQVLRDGWLFTGDIATLDADGYATIVDRKKDLIDVGGLKVYPREVEEVLFEHPAVQEAAVVGAADEALGEVVRAFVVLKPGASANAPELIAFVRGHIAHYKAPRTVEFVGELPKSGVQKVLRRVLRDAAAVPAPSS